MYNLFDTGLLQGQLHVEEDEFARALELSLKVSIFFLLRLWFLHPWSLFLLIMNCFQTAEQEKAMRDQTLEDRKLQGVHGSSRRAEKTNHVREKVCTKLVNFKIHKDAQRCKRINMSLKKWAVTKIFENVFVIAFDIRHSGGEPRPFFLVVCKIPHMESFLQVVIC
jgi:hypothetical protein